MFKIESMKKVCDFVCMDPRKGIELPADDVHIWSVFLPEHEKNKDYFASILSMDEHERANGFRFSIDKTRFTITRGILRCILSRYLGEKPETLEFLYGLWGKPCLPEEKTLHFNISHSRDYALCALVRHYEVGVDLEYIDTTLDLERIAESLFSQSELNDWVKQIPTNKLNFFYRFWTGAEAFLKALGKGWLEEKQMPFTKTSLLEQKVAYEAIATQVTYPYFFQSIPSYASALYVQGPSLNAIYRSWNFTNF